VYTLSTLTRPQQARCDKKHQSNFCRQSNAIPLNPHTTRFTAADLCQVSKSQEQDNIERTVASGRHAAPSPLRRPWRSWAPPIFGNVFCPEDLEDHYHRQYHPQGLTRAQAQQQLQHQQQQEEADRLFAEALVPAAANSLFCSQPSLVLSPDGCEVGVARRLKQTSDSTELSTQNRSYQPKVSGMYQISPMCACHELQSTFLLPLSSLDVEIACLQSTHAV